MPMLRRCDGMSETGWPSNRMSPASGDRKSGDQVQRRRLAGTARAEQRNESACGNIQRDVVDRTKRCRSFVSCEAPRTLIWAPCTDPDCAAGLDAVIGSGPRRCCSGSGEHGS